MKNKEVALLVTIGLYALNIIDANVDAHLLQYNVDEKLSLALSQFKKLDFLFLVGDPRIEAVRGDLLPRQLKVENDHIGRDPAATTGAAHPPPGN